MKIAIGNDHRGYDLKVRLVYMLVAMGHEVQDCGSTNKTDSVDYPDYAELVCDRIPTQADRGILICGTGIGMSIAANKKHGIRAALVTSITDARLCHEHNFCNVMCLPSQFASSYYDDGFVRQILDGFARHSRPTDRHQRRLDKITDLEVKWASEWMRANT